MNFEVELPKIYVTQSDGQRVTSQTRGSLVIHRMNFDFWRCRSIRYNFKT